MNSFVNGLAAADNVTLTENNGVALKSTMNKLYDLFALGGAYRKRSWEDCVLLFKNAWKEDPEYALKCLFYLRDAREGQGERRFFRNCMRWLALIDSDTVWLNLENIVEFGRWDDLFIFFDTPIERDMIKMIHEQLKLDMECKTPSLCAKWMPSENASSKETKALAKRFRKAFKIDGKTYRQILSTLRKRINIVETLMSQNRWDEIEFDKIPSKAGLKYRNAFAHKDILKKKYEAFIKNEKTNVNAKTLFPYEIVSEAVKDSNWASIWLFGEGHIKSYKSEVDRIALEKYWNNLPDYLNGKDCSMMCVVDTSGSMQGREAAAPINVAIALAMYCAERIGGEFKDYFITFSKHPELIKIEGIDFVDKVLRIYERNQCENTNLEATFDLIYNMVVDGTIRKEDVPKTLCIISDMEIDGATTFGWHDAKHRVATMMETMRTKWAAAGLKLPKLVYWNVQSRNSNKFLDDGPNITYVSGASPVIFESVLTGKTGMDVMYEILNKDRYNVIKIA